MKQTSLMKPFRPDIRRFESLPSTNTEAARQAAQGADEGLCIVAAEQTAGRGRLQRAWSSPKGAGLYFSIVLRPQMEQRYWPLTTLMASLAVCEALRESYGLETDIKWPNDILANERKLSGILAETIETDTGRALVVGIGINLTNNAFPPELNDVATSVENVAGRSIDLEVVLEALTRSFRKFYEAIHQLDGPAVIVSEWSRQSSYAVGKHVQVREGEESYCGTTRGLESDGALRVEMASGGFKLVRAGDVTSVRASRQ
jgi:BirA family transcriptional regulator, biotin operon repressor / biotin---[acetyl-CoA-carboxylase] ligase